MLRIRVKYLPANEQRSNRSKAVIVEIEPGMSLLEHPMDCENCLKASVDDSTDVIFNSAWFPMRPIIWFELHCSSGSGNRSSKTAVQSVPSHYHRQQKKQRQQRQQAQLQLQQPQSQPQQHPGEERPRSWWGAVRGPRRTPRGRKPARTGGRTLQLSD